jgi:hypothetical protein
MYKQQVINFIIDNLLGEGMDTAEINTAYTNLKHLPNQLLLETYISMAGIKQASTAYTYIGHNMIVGAN